MLRMLILFYEDFDAYLESIAQHDPFQDDADKSYLETVSEPCWHEFWKYSGYVSERYPLPDLSIRRSIA